ncbi:MAG: nucleotidyltransferase family protein [Halioglobus sp.]|nr:nucleotidyltransferase family protein [Halioglobus sp.]
MPRLIAVATSQDVLPALAVRCYEDPGLAGTIDEASDQQLRAALLVNTRRNMQIVVQSIQLIRALNRAGIKPLMLKGTAQLLTVNRENPGFRKQADIDLIVPPEAVLAAGEALQAQGYAFYRNKRLFEAPPGVPADTQAALRISTAHHHLPPLVKNDHIAYVELHRHFLPRRFQHRNPLAPLFDSASEHQLQDACFLVPSTEYQVIHLVLGKLVHDGYLARRDFPLREACDYLDLLDNAGGDFDSRLVAKHCGRALSIFDQLVTALMTEQPTRVAAGTTDISRRLGMMRTRYDFPTRAKLLDLYARGEHLAYSLLYSPSKLAAYISR